VVHALKAFGAVNTYVADKGCIAVYSLSAGNRENKKELIRVGARDAVNRSLENEAKSTALNALK
jgi:hypothetical protein